MKAVMHTLQVSEPKTESPGMEGLSSGILYLVSYLE